MTGRRPDARRRQRRAAALIASTVLGCGANAQSADEVVQPIGFPAGPFVIGPSLTTGYAYDSNVFLLSETAEPPPSPDQVLTVQPVLELTLPFSNSSARFKDTLNYVDYKETPQTAGKYSNTAEAGLTLNFGTRDTIDLAARHIDGVAETLAFDPGGEVTFRGNAYRLHSETASVSRAVEGARGYRLSLTRNVVIFDPSEDVTFFNYRGFEGDAAYLQPLSSNTRLAFGYVGARYDHYDVSSGSDPYAVFRTESGDAVYAQIEGRLGPKQPYSVRLGWENLDFTGNTAKDFRGVIGDARMAVIFGGGTTVTAAAQRQPYRSFFQDNNFYVLEQLGAQLSHPFARQSSVGVNATFWRTAYGEPGPLPAPEETTLVYRHDQAVRLEAYANLALRDGVVFRLSVLRMRKYANFPGADYNDTVVFGGFIFGWF